MNKETLHRITNRALASLVNSDESQAGWFSKKWLIKKINKR
jgi:hypothetical protein